MLTIACVRTGDKYGVEYVERLRNMVARHLPVPHRFVCYTDQPDALPRYIERIAIGALGLSGWWAKMYLFGGSMRPMIYFDLDTVICGDLTPLAEWSGDFAICENFTKRAGHANWPCNYGSCVMSFGPGFGADVWSRFWRDRHRIMEECTRGDQQAIERLYPNAALLQDVMPAGYFMSWRDVTDTPSKDAAVVCFGGSHRPHNSPYQWIKDAWI